MKLNDTALSYKNNKKFFDGNYYYFHVEKEKISIRRVKGIHFRNNQTEAALIYTKISGEDDFRIFQIDDLLIQGIYHGNQDEFKIENVLRRLNAFHEAQDRKQRIKPNDLNSLEIHFKNLSDLKVYYFLGNIYPKYSLDKSKKRWGVIIISILLFLASYKLYIATLTIALITIFPLAIYYESRMNNFFLERFVRINYYHIINESNQLTLKIENIIEKTIPRFEVDYFITMCNKLFNQNDFSNEVETIRFNFADFFGPEYDANLQGEITRYNSKGKQTYQCKIFIEDRFEKKHFISELYVHKNLNT